MLCVLVSGIALALHAVVGSTLPNEYVVVAASHSSGGI